MMMIMIMMVKVMVLVIVMKYVFQYPNCICINPSPGGRFQKRPRVAVSPDTEGGESLANGWPNKNKTRDVCDGKHVEL